MAALPRSKVDRRMDPSPVASVVSSEYHSTYTPGKSHCTLQVSVNFALSKTVCLGGMWLVEGIS